MSEEAQLRVIVKGWEDGEKVDKEIDEPDRWTIQAGDTVCFPNKRVLIHAYTFARIIFLHAHARTQAYIITSLGYRYHLWKYICMHTIHIEALFKKHFAASGFLADFGLRAN